MKKTILFFMVAFLTISGAALGQSNKKNVEVLYFKANLACCKARACNRLEANVKAIIQKNFPDGSVTFRTVRIADETNKDLVEKHNAKSQTVVIVDKKRKKENVVDVSAIVAEYARNYNKIKFETELVDKINSCL